MKTRILIPLALLSFMLIAGACRAPVSQLIENDERTAAYEHYELDYRVWLPEGYHDDPVTRYPLLVWFHGGGESEAGWGREGKIGEIVHMRVKGGTLKPFIVVSPSAGSFTPVYRSYEKILLEQVLPRVRAEYRVTDKTVAFGHSMGGLSALSIALRNPELFDAVAVASPFVFDTRPWDLPEEKQAYDTAYGDQFISQWRYELKVEFDKPAAYEPWDPFNLVRKNATNVDFPILLTTGDSDPLGLYSHNRLLHERMEVFGVEHEWYVQEGVGHGTVEDPYVMKWLNDNAH